MCGPDLYISLLNLLNCRKCVYFVNQQSCLRVSSLCNGLDGCWCTFILVAIECSYFNFGYMHRSSGGLAILITNHQHNIKLIFLGFSLNGIWHLIGWSGQIQLIHHTNTNVHAYIWVLNEFEELNQEWPNTTHRHVNSTGGLCCQRVGSLFLNPRFCLLIKRA